MMSFTSFLESVTLIELVGIVEGHGECPRDWQGGLDVGACYYLPEINLKWREAATNYCPMIRPGSKLAEPRTRKHMDLLGHMSGQWKGPWIGLNDGVEEGKFRWTSDGKIPNETFWGTEEPNDGDDNEDCVTFWNDGIGRRYWNDFDCEEALYPVCEIEPYWDIKVNSDVDEEDEEDTEETSDEWDFLKNWK